MKQSILKYTICIVLLSLLQKESLFAQNPIWYWADTHSKNDYGIRVATDNLGNSIGVGSFEDTTIQIGSTLLTNFAPGKKDIFVAKYDGSGNVIWAKSFGGNKIDIGIDAKVDSAGNIYVIGIFTSNVITIGPYSLTSNGGGNNNMMVLKMDSAGNVIWARSYGAAGEDWVSGITIDHGGNCYIAGQFESQICNFDNIALQNASTQVLTGFITKIDTAGSVVWAKATSNTGGIYSITCDYQNNLIFAGRFFFSNISISNSPVLSSAGLTEIFVGKMDTSANVFWMKSAGGNSNDNADWVSSSPNGEIYVCGSTTSSQMNFDSLSVVSSGSQDGFIVKYKSNGQVSWAKAFGGSGFDNGHTLSAHSNGVYLSGYYTSTIFSFGGNQLICNGINSDCFISSLDTAGNIIGLVGYGNTGIDYMADMDIDASGKIIVGGCFNSTSLALGNLTLTNPYSSGYVDFIGKLETNLSVGFIANAEKMNINAYPNPTFNILNVEIEDICHYQLLSAIGQRIMQGELHQGVNQLDMTNLSNGIYFISFENSNGESGSISVIKK